MQFGSYGDLKDDFNVKARAKRSAPGGGGGKGDKSWVVCGEEGAWFRSYRDGIIHALSPEGSVRTQKQLGADIIIPLDHLPPYNVSNEGLQESVYLSHRWMARLV